MIRRNFEMEKAEGRIEAGSRVRGTLPLPRFRYTLAGRRNLNVFQNTALVSLVQHGLNGLYQLARRRNA